MIRNPVTDTIMRRRSTRAFAPDMPEAQVLDTLLACGQYAPSAMNRQPWHFALVTDAALIRRISKECGDAMRASGDEYAMRIAADPAYDVFYGAPVLIVVSGKGKGGSAMDCGLASQNIVLAAESMGLGSCYVGLARFALDGPNKDEYRARLQVPEEYATHFAIAIGVPAGPAREAPERVSGTISRIS